MSISNESLWGVTEVLAPDAPADASARLNRGDEVLRLIDALLHDRVEDGVLATTIGTWRGVDVEVLAVARKGGPAVGAQEALPIAILLRSDQAAEVEPT